MKSRNLHINLHLAVFCSIDLLNAGWRYIMVSGKFMVNNAKPPNFNLTLYQLRNVNKMKFRRVGQKDAGGGRRRQRRPRWWKRQRRRRRGRHGYDRGRGDRRLGGRHRPRLRRGQISKSRRRFLHMSEFHRRASTWRRARWRRKYDCFCYSADSHCG